MCQETRASSHGAPRPDLTLAGVCVHLSSSPGIEYHQHRRKGELAASSESSPKTCPVDAIIYCPVASSARLWIPHLQQSCTQGLRCFSTSPGRRASPAASCEGWVQWVARAHLEACLACRGCLIFTESAQASVTSAPGGCSLPWRL